MNDGLYGEIKRAARTVALEWPDVIGPDDLEQEIWSKLLESKNYIDQINAMTLAKKRASLQRIGHQLASAERNSYAVFSGHIRYSGDEVLRLLQNRGLERLEDTVVSTLATTNNDEHENRIKIHRNSYRPEDDTVDRIDLQIAMDRLKTRNNGYWAALMNHYLFGTPVGGGTNRTRISRARRVLVNEMNRSYRNRMGDYGGPGSRQAESNIRCIERTRNQYNSERPKNVSPGYYE